MTDDFEENNNRTFENDKNDKFSHLFNYLNPQNIYDSIEVFFNPQKIICDNEKSLNEIKSQNSAKYQNNENDLDKELIDKKEILFIDKNNLDKNSSNKVSSSRVEENKKGKIEENKKSNRKRKRDEGNNNEHNKYSIDNIRRKLKGLILKSLRKFLNTKIKIIYNDNIRKGIKKKELLMLNKSQQSNANIDFNKKFLKKKLSEIFSDNISTRYTNYPLDHNKEVINDLMNESNEEKKNYFNKLFNLDFFQCMRHFRGEEHIEILDGLTNFIDLKDKIIKNNVEEGNEYYETLKYNLNNFEEIINNKSLKNLKKEIYNKELK